MDECLGPILIFWAGAVIGFAVALIWAALAGADRQGQPFEPPEPDEHGQTWNVR
jgi:hypothetical protein